MDGLLFPFPHPDPLTASDTIFPIHGMLSSPSFEDSLSWFSSHLSLGCLVSFAGSSFPYQWEFSRVPAPASALPPLLLSLVTFINSGSTATFVPPSYPAVLPVSSTCPKCTYAGFLVPPSLNPLCPNTADNCKETITHSYIPYRCPWLPDDLVALLGNLRPASSLSLTPNIHPINP